MEYNYKNGSFLKDGHTMFEQDVLKDLKRLAYLEGERSKGTKLEGKTIEDWKRVALSHMDTIEAQEPALENAAQLVHEWDKEKDKLLRKIKKLKKANKKIKTLEEENKLLQRETKGLKKANKLYKKSNRELQKELDGIRDRARKGLEETAVVFKEIIGGCDKRSPLGLLTDKLNEEIEEPEALKVGDKVECLVDYSRVNWNTKGFRGEITQIDNEQYRIEDENQVVYIFLENKNYLKKL